VITIANSNKTKFILDSSSAECVCANKATVELCEGKDFCICLLSTKREKNNLEMKEKGIFSVHTKKSVVVEKS